jgi:hypothetical protein
MGTVLKKPIWNSYRYRVPVPDHVDAAPTVAVQGPTVITR